MMTLLKSNLSTLQIRQIGIYYGSLFGIVEIFIFSFLSLISLVLIFIGSYLAVVTISVILEKVKLGTYDPD